MSATCTITACDDPICARSLCRKHYLQAWRADELATHPTRTVRRCPAAHPHDLRCSVEHHCGCGACQRERRNWRQRRATRLKAYGRDHSLSPEMTDATPAREHVRTLMRAGCALERIAEAAGVGRGTAANLVYGARGSRKTRGVPTEIRADAAARFLAVTAEEISSGTVPGLGTMRRLQALVAIGYTESELAKQLGMQVGNFGRLVHGARPVVLATTAAAVHDLYERFSATPSQGRAAGLARRLAKRHRWVSPLAWDDIDTDIAPNCGDAGFVVDMVAVELATRGESIKIHPAERRIAVEKLHALRLSDSEIAARLRCDPKTVLMIRTELTLPAWSLSELSGMRALKRFGRTDR